MTQENEPKLPTNLESDVRVRRAEIIAKLAELRNDARKEANIQRDTLKAKLSELSQLTKDYVINGWANLGATGKFQFGYWLGR